MDLQEYIKKVIDEILNEDEGGEGNTSDAVGEYSTPYAFYPHGWKKVKKPKKSKVVDYKNLNEETPRFTSNISGKSNNKKFNLPKIPTEVPLPKELVGKDKPFSTASGPTGTILLATPMAKVALDAIEKGRTSFEKEEKLYTLTKIFKDKLPGETRRVIKKGLDGVREENGRFVVNAEVVEDKGDVVMLKNIMTEYEITPEGLKILRALKNKEGLPNNLKLKDIHIKQLVDIFLKKPGAWAPAELKNNNLVRQKDDFRIQNKLYEGIVKMLNDELLNEVTYTQFKKEARFRTKSEQLHKAIKEVKKKIQEIDRIVEYTSRMKQELSEDGGLNYWKATEKYVGQISEMISHLNNRIKNLNQ